MCVPYLQAIYNAPTSAAPLEDIRALGFRGIRMDVQRSDKDTVRACLASAAAAGLESVSIVRLEQLPWFPPGAQVELRNEPDLEGPEPAAYAREMHAASLLAESYGLRLWVGGISNPTSRGLRYLLAICPMLERLSGSVGFSWHRYPAGGADEGFARPHDGFRCREDEVAFIRHRIGDRP